ncbi:MAG: DNA-binding protein [Lachnospiraceae bacterium]|nr:DNA-binding protein [Lachnospiraceae bacterium]
MDKILEESLLYDFYGELLTPKQREIYESVRFGDLSLSEAAEEYGVSRQGIHDMIRRSTRTLEKYEEKLGLIAQFTEMKRIAGEIKRCCAELENVARKEETLRELRSIADLSDKLLDL